MPYKASESAKNDAYARGYADAKRGKFSPARGDRLVDAIFSPLDALAGTPSTREHAEAVAESYRLGHAAGCAEIRQR